MTKHVFHNINKIITSIYIDYIQTIVNYNINVCTTGDFYYAYGGGKYRRVTSGTPHLEAYTIFR